MGILLVVFLSELSTFEHFNDFLDTFNTDIEESRVLGRGGGGLRSLTGSQCSVRLAWL